MGSKGVASGNARVIINTSSDEFIEGEILVCDMTSPDYLPLMQKAAAIVTDRGGILCHATIIARELKKPCIVATGDATEKIKTGDFVIVDADKGIVTRR
ncbi:MAG: PEP-utilizing enzyme [Candidatus Nanoarchaeia archaeon]